MAPCCSPYVTCCTCCKCAGTTTATKCAHDAGCSGPARPRTTPGQRGNRGWGAGTVQVRAAAASQARCEMRLLVQRINLMLARSDHQGGASRRQLASPRECPLCNANMQQAVDTAMLCLLVGQARQAGTVAGHACATASSQGRCRCRPASLWVLQRGLYRLLLHPPTLPQA